MTPEYEAWAIAWARGGDIELHDHGDSHGVLTVVRGELTESYTTRLDHPLCTRKLGARMTIAFGADHIHDIVNLGDTLAMSVHVYAPHLSSMTFYDDQLRPIRNEPLVLGQHVG